jgi:hypothetical protein
MNTNLDRALNEDPRFDQLVDGELGDNERRELLAGLDRQPGGWRRCALAFLEAQCWKQSFATTAREGLLTTAGTKSLRPAQSRWSWHVGTMLAMAASFLAVFWIGSLVQKGRLDRPTTPAGAIGQLASNAGGSPQALSASKPWQMVTVSAPAGSTLRVPAAERNNIDQQWLQNLPPAMPEDVLQAFNRTGHQIQQHRELVPIPLNDGRQMVVPVDQVDVHYTGNTTY